MLIIRSNPLVNSPRVTKIALSLRKKYQVRGIGWNRENLPTSQFDHYVIDIDVLSLSAPVGKLKLALYFPLFWCYIFAKLVRYRPNIVHACDLDTVPPAFLYKLLFGKRIVFDVCDRYAMSKIPNRRKMLYSLVDWLEEMYASRVDCVINVSDRLAETFTRKPKQNIIVMNCADETYFQEHPEGKKEIEKRYGEYIKSDKLKLIYTGNVVRNRGIEQIVRAIDGLEYVSLFIAGKVIDRELFEKITHSINVVYFGHLPLAESLSLEQASDVMITLYDPRIPYRMYAMPNKLFEAMMFSLPVITNVSKCIVEKTQSGIIVNYDDILEIRDGVTKLNNLEFRKRLGRNGRKAFENEYNWRRMEEALYSLYDNLLK